MSFSTLFSSPYFSSFLFSSQPNIPLRFLQLGFKGTCQDALNTLLNDFVVHFFINKVKHYTQMSRKTHITIINCKCKFFLEDIVRVNDSNKND